MPKEGIEKERKQGRGRGEELIKEDMEGKEEERRKEQL